MAQENKADCLHYLPVAAFAVDQTGKITGVNEAALELLDKSSSELVGKRAWTAFSAKRRPTAIDEALTSGVTETEEFSLNDIELRVTVRPRLDEQGDPISAIAVLEKKLGASTTSAETEAKLRAIDRVQAVIEFNMDGTVIVANDNFLGALGYSLAEIQGQHHRMFVEPQYATSRDYSEFWAKLNRGEFESREYKRLGKGGKEVWIQASYNPVLDAKGKPYKVVKFATDVTAQVKLRMKAQQLQGIVENSPKPTMLVDLETFAITYANPVAIETLRKLEAYLPVRASEVVGKSVDMFQKDPANQRRLLADERNLPHEERIKLGPETLQLQTYALRDAEGKYVGPALVWEVITERATLEAADVRAKEIVKQVQVALSSLAAGDIDAQLDEKFEGEFEAMRQNVNGIAGVLQAFRTECDNLTAAAREGRLSERADASQFQGAYADIIQGINSILEAIMGPVNNIREKLGRVADGDLTAYVTDDYQGDHAALRDALNASLDGLNRLLGQVSDAANQITTSAGQVSDAAQDLSQGASEQAATIEEISAQMVQMTNQTHQNAENASQANQLAVAARDGAEAGDRRMTEMVGAMRAIEEASNNISKIIKVIDEIAFQTNLLALNAAVEAARAGVHGKGFAVVAEEVRNLAARSARAAKETTEMIEGSIKKVTQGTNIAQETAAALNRIVQDVGKVTSLVAEIAAASNEQAEGISQINQGLEQVNEVTQRNTATAEESAASAEEMSGQTSEMRSMVQKFKLQEAGSPLTALSELPKELQGAVQRYMQQLMGAAPPSPVARAQAPVAKQNGKTNGKSPAPSTVAAAPRKLGKANPESVISLDSRDFGKY